MEDEETWLAFSEISLNARLRNAMELFRSPTHGPGSRKENGALAAPVSRGSGGIREEAAGLELAAPTAAGLGGWGSAAGALAAESEETAGEELKRA